MASPAGPPNTQPHARPAAGWGPPRGTRRLAPPVRPLARHWGSKMAPDAAGHAVRQVRPCRQCVWRSSVEQGLCPSRPTLPSEQSATTAGRAAAMVPCCRRTAMGGRRPWHERPCTLLHPHCQHRWLHDRMPGGPLTGARPALQGRCSYRRPRGGLLLQAHKRTMDVCGRSNQQCAGMPAYPHPLSTMLKSAVARAHRQAAGQTAACIGPGAPPSNNGPPAASHRDTRTLEGEGASDPAPCPTPVR